MLTSHTLRLEKTLMTSPTETASSSAIPVPFPKCENRCTWQTPTEGYFEKNRWNKNKTPPPPKAVEPTRGEQDQKWGGIRAWGCGSTLTLCRVVACRNGNHGPCNWKICIDNNWQQMKIQSRKKKMRMGSNYRVQTWRVEDRVFRKKGAYFFCRTLIRPPSFGSTGR